MAEWVNGIYLTTDIVLKYPDYVERLRDEIGLNTVVLSFNGELPKEVLDLSPYEGRVPTDEALAKLVIRHFDGRPVDPREYEQARAMCGPGVSKNGSDKNFRQAVGQLKDAGLKVWTCGGAWTIRRLTFCPSQKATQDWLEAVYVHLATQYDVDALDITHLRYPMGSFPLGLFGCTCRSCHLVAKDLGYDMDKMVADLKHARHNLQSLDGERLGDVVRLGFGFFDVIIDGNDVINSKPHPEGFIMAANLTNTLPENCVVFEDSIAGVEGANSINMYTIGIGDKKGLKNANKVYQNFNQFSLKEFTE